MVFATADTAGTQIRKDEGGTMNEERGMKDNRSIVHPSSFIIHKS
jgi:hypothetical protein